LQVAKAYDTRVQRTGTIYYPFWENAARTMENRWALWAVSLLFWGVYPVAYAVAAAVHYGRRNVKNGGYKHEKKLFHTDTGVDGYFSLRMRYKR
jgi:hypothetical protein